MEIQQSDVTAPLVSVIIRTHQRPEVLRRALDSLQNQQFKNFEILVAEDGENVSQAFLEQEYPSLPILYFSTGKSVGRSCVGNLALRKAKGKYINFLDDDDYFLPTHLYSLVNALEVSEAMAAYSVAEEHQIDLPRSSTSRAMVKRKIVRYRQSFSRLLLYEDNYLPIQSVLFERSLYETLGGFDETLDLLEDWDLWVRYSTKTDFAFVDEVTSVYHCPYNRKNTAKRAKGWMKPRQHLLKDKFSTYSLTLSVSDLRKETALLANSNPHPYLHAMRTVYRMIFWGER